MIWIILGSAPVYLSYVVWSYGHLILFADEKLYGLPCTCVYVCMCVCIHVCLCLHMFVSVRVCVWAWIQQYKYSNSHF